MNVMDIKGSQPLHRCINPPVGYDPRYIVPSHTDEMSPTALKSSLKKKNNRRLNLSSVGGDIMMSPTRKHPHFQTIDARSGDRFISMDLESSVGSHVTDKRIQLEDSHPGDLLKKSV